MAKKRRGKHVPQRTCVGCHQTLAKRQLVRLVRTPEGVRVDLTGRQPGRGAYLHDRRSCWERALKKGTLARALRVELTDDDIARLKAFMAVLPDDDGEEDAAEASSRAG